VFVGVDFRLNQHKARSKAHAIFFDKSDVEVDEMNLEDIQVYAKAFHDGLNDLIGYKGYGTGSVCDTIDINVLM